MCTTLCWLVGGYYPLGREARREAGTHGGIQGHFMVSLCPRLPSSLHLSLPPSVLSFLIPFVVSLSPLLSPSPPPSPSRPLSLSLSGVDIPSASSRGISVARIPSAHTGNAVACAEHAIYLALSLLRKQVSSDTPFTSRSCRPVHDDIHRCTLRALAQGGAGDWAQRHRVSPGRTLSFH